MINDDLSKQLKRLIEKSESIEPGTKEYHEIMSDIKELDSCIRANDKAEAELGIKDREHERAEELHQIEIEKEAAKLAEMKKPWIKRIDPNTVVSSGVTLIGIFSMLNFEKIGNITSKVISFIPKPRMKG